MQQQETSNPVALAVFGSLPCDYGTRDYTLSTDQYRSRWIQVCDLSVVTILYICPTVDS